MCVCGNVTLATIAARAYLYTNAARLNNAQNNNGMVNPPIPLEIPHVSYVDAPVNSVGIYSITLDNLLPYGIYHNVRSVAFEMLPAVADNVVALADLVLRRPATTLYVLAETHHVRDDAGGVYVPFEVKGIYTDAQKASEATMHYKAAHDQFHGHAGGISIGINQFPWEHAMHQTIGVYPIPMDTLFPDGVMNEVDRAHNVMAHVYAAINDDNNNRVGRHRRPGG